MIELNRSGCYHQTKTDLKHRDCCHQTLTDLSQRDYLNQRDQLMREIVTKRLYCCTTCARYIYCQGSFLNVGLSLVNRKYMHG